MPEQPSPSDLPLTGPSTAEPARRNYTFWCIAALLVLVTIAVYWPATRCGFINYDDTDFVTANRHVQAGLNWEGVKWAFRNTEQASYWAPLMWLSHMLAWQCFGMHPWGHHLLNVLLHAFNTLLVFLVFRRMTGATWRSSLLAALFGWHPLRVESVVWVTERKDVLSAMFWLLTLWAYGKYVAAVQARNSKSKLWYGAALGLLALGLMSKPMLVTVPCVMLLLDYWPLRRFQPSNTWRLVLEKLPFFVLAAVACLLTLAVQQHGSVLAMNAQFSFGARAGNALVSYCRYLGKLFWPTELAVFYPYPGPWPTGKVVLAAGLLVGISGLLFVLRRRHPFLLMGWLWFCGTLVPVIGLVQSGAQAMADRFTYMPSLGVLIVVIWGAYELTRRWHYGGWVSSFAGSAAIILCLALTRHQIGYWKDSETLFRHALEVTQDNFVAHNNLGNALGMKGRTDEAITQFQEAIRLKPNDAEAHYNLGIALYQLGQTELAISQYRAAILLKPDHAAAHCNLGTALGVKGLTDEAISQFREAIRLNPADAEAHYNLGVALGIKGQISEAITQYREALRLKPDYAEARLNLARALGMQNAPSNR